MARQMKDSGVEWIGEIPEGWEVRKLKSIITCKDGERVPIDSGLREAGPYPYWGAGNITDHVNNYLFDEELVLLGEDGAPFFDKKRNVAFLVCEKIWVNNHIHVLKADKGVISPYLVHFLNIVDFGSYINGSILNKLTQSNMNRINVAFPDENEQQKIADFLDEKVGKIDSVIAKTKETIEDYKKYKQVIITDAVTKGLNPDVEMKESGVKWIGKIPRNWNCMKLRHVVEKIGDIDHYMPETQPQGIPYVMTGDLQNLTSNINFEKCKKVSYEDFQELSNKIQVNYGDVILARYATIGTVSYVDINKNFLVSYSCVIIKPTSFLKGKFLFYYTKTSSFIEELKKYTNANTQGNVGIDSLYQVKMLLPPIKEQEDIIAYLDEKCSEIDKLITKKEELLADLESYKKSFIYEYVTGKKEVIL
ncbi:MAG: restriction endonuclease subunit S [Clostridium sp.]|nr:restriction endonuclease subunit S [Clostridium sp.]